MIWFCYCFCEGVAQELDYRSRAASSGPEVFGERPTASFLFAALALLPPEGGQGLRKGGTRAEVAQVGGQLFEGRFETGKVGARGEDILPQLIDRLFLGCEPARIIDRSVGVVAILSLEDEDLILEPGVFGAQGLLGSLAVGDLGAWNHRAPRAERQEGEDREPAPSTLEGTNHSFRLLSGTIVRGRGLQEGPPPSEGGQSRPPHSCDVNRRTGPQSL